MTVRSADDRRPSQGGARPGSPSARSRSTRNIRRLIGADRRRRPGAHRRGARARRRRRRAQRRRSAAADARRRVPHPHRSRRRGRGAVRGRRTESADRSRSRRRWPDGGNHPCPRRRRSASPSATSSRSSGSPTCSSSSCCRRSCSCCCSPTCSAARSTSPVAATASSSSPGSSPRPCLFGATFTGAGLADDMQKGIIDRFRSLPMARSAVLVGPHGERRGLQRPVDLHHGRSPGCSSAGGSTRRSSRPLWRLRCCCCCSPTPFSWVMAYVGLLVPSVEVVNNASFMVIFPLTFIANTFVPVEDLPGPLQTFAEWNPVSSVTQAARELFGNIPPGTPEPDGVAAAEPRALHADLDRRRSSPCSRRSRSGSTSEPGAARGTGSSATPPSRYDGQRRRWTATALRSPSASPPATAARTTRGWAPPDPSARPTSPASSRIRSRSLATRSRLNATGVASGSR